MANSFLDKTGLSYFWEKVKGRLALKQDKLPTGTSGQMLYQGESGPEWGDKPVMYVNITEDGGTITADKTFNEILQAFNSGYPVIAKYIIDPVANYPILLPLMFAAETAIYFTVYNLIDNQGSHIFIGFLPDGTILKQEQFPEAEHVSFTPGETGLTSNNIQDAIEELVNKSESSSVMYVHITQGEGETYTADKTLEEIGNAYSSGVAVYAIMDSVVFPLYQCQPSIIAIFYLHSSNKEFSIFIDNNGVSAGISDFKASSVAFAPGTTGLTSNNVQDAIEEVASAQSTAAQLDYSKMKSLHALGITDLNNVVEPGTYVGMSGIGGYPAIVNIPEDLVVPFFYMDVYVFDYPGDDYSNHVVEQHIYPITAPYVGFNRYGNSNSPDEALIFGPWFPNLSAAATKMKVIPGLSADNVQDAIEEMANDMEMVTNGLPKQVSVTLSASAWSSNSQTVTVSGVLADETKQLIHPCSAMASQEAYYAAGIRCTAQAADSLTFTCETAPTEDLTVYVAIQEVTT